MENKNEEIKIVEEKMKKKAIVEMKKDISEDEFTKQALENGWALNKIKSTIKIYKENVEKGLFISLKGIIALDRAIIND